MRTAPSPPTAGRSARWPPSDRDGENVPDRVEASRARAMRRFYTVSLVYVAIFAMAFALVGVHVLPLAGLGVITGYCIAGHLVLFAVLRSGRAMRFREPSCAFAHVLFSISALLLGCVMLPQNRVSAVQVMFLIIAFDLTRLTRRQVAGAAGLTITGLVLVLFGDWLQTGDDAAMRRELQALAMASVYVPMLVAIGQSVRQISTRKASQRAALASALGQLRTLSERDALTGASNRRHAETLVEKEAARHARYRGPLSIAMLDIDHFKRINDRHGHAAGDAVLIALVQRLEAALPASFTLARWGGEEFIVVMPDTDLPAAAAEMRRVRGEIVAADWSGCAPGLQVDVSVGVCEHAPGATVEATIEAADKLLYCAKREGRGRVVEHAH